jgi:hypothetical protein
MTACLRCPYLDVLLVRWWGIACRKDAFDRR